MLDDATPTEASVEVPRCMWCSAVLPSGSETTCPTCGATLVGEGDSPVPGVTAIDAEAIIRGSREQKPQRRNRLMSWISGDYPEEDRPAPPGSLEPPPLEVRREMLRLELEAQVANAQAEVEAMAADAAIENGTPLELPGVTNEAATDGELVAGASDPVEDDETVAEATAGDATAGDAAPDEDEGAPR
jgi:hypothetical protein